MPAYEYVCPQHGVFEKIISFRDHKDSFPCPKPRCGKSSEQRVSKPAAAIFKGSGFHCTDYGAPTKR